MVYFVGFFGAVVVMFLLSRVSLWLFSSLGDGLGRVALAHAVALAAATIGGGFMFAEGGMPRFSAAFASYCLPAAFCAAFDLMRLWRHRAVDA